MAPLVLVGGLTLGLNQLADRWPRERRLEVVLERPETVTRLDVSWTPEAEVTDTLQSTSWRFEAGTAPRTIVTMVRLPSGEYAVELSLERETGSTKERRPVRVAGDEVRIFLR